MTASIDRSTPEWTSPTDRAEASEVDAATAAPVAAENQTETEATTFDVAVLINCHNYGDFIGDAVRSALAQRGVRVQVVVVDDGSTDDSVEVVHALMREHPGRIELRCQPNGGQASAMNAGFARSRAPIVIFLDADDVLHPTTAQRCAQAFEGTEAVRVQYPMRLVDRTGAPTGATVPADPARLATGDLRAEVLSHPDDLTWQPTSGNAFTADVLRRILPMPEAPYRTCADHYLLNLSALLGPVLVLDDEGADYRAHGANADRRDHLDVERIRTVIDRTVETHRALATTAADLGWSFPSDPLAVPSVTFFVNRLVSLRLDPARHRVVGDTRIGLVRGGVVAAGMRSDLPLARRASMAAWFAATGAAPRPVARSLIKRALLAPRADREVVSSPTTESRSSGEAGAVRSDWRFLLPSRPPAVPAATKGSTPSTPAPIVTTRVVRSATSRGAVRAIAANLEPGELVWLTVDRRRRGARALTPGRAEHAARAIGVTTGPPYLLAPDANTPKRFVPLDHAGALRWYLRNQVVAGSWAQVVTFASMRTILRLVGPGPIRGMAPSYGVLLSREPGIERDANDGRLSRPEVIERSSTALGIDDPAGSRTLVLTSGQDEASRAVLVPFGPDAGEPTGIVKVAAVPAFNDDTIGEIERLARLRATLPGELASAIPAPLGRATTGEGLPIAVQSAGRGRPIEVRARSIDTRRVERIDDLDAAIAWLGSMQRATARPAPRPTAVGWQHQLSAADGFWHDVLCGPIDDVRRLVITSSPADLAPAARLLVRDLDRIESLARATLTAHDIWALPVVERHHDFIPVNVLRATDGSIEVIDWELPPGQPTSGPPLVDALLFVTFWYGAVHRSATPAEDLHGVDRLLGPAPDPVDDPYHGAAWAAVRDYCRVVDIDVAVTPLLLAALWLERHRAAAERAIRLGTDPVPVVATPLASRLAILTRRWEACSFELER